MYKVLFVNAGGKIGSRKTWSGIPFSISRELKKSFDVIEFNVDMGKTIADKVYITACRLLLRESCMWQYTARLANHVAIQIQDAISKYSPDIIFAIGLSCVSNLNTDIPVIYFSDAVFSSMINYYYFGLKKREIKKYNKLQQLALNNADKIIVASEWAKNEAIEDYCIEETKIRVVHFGANIENNELKKEKHHDINLLFVGAELKRKGIDVAIECVKKCNALDSEHKYYLHVVGGRLPELSDEEYIKWYGFIDRNIDEQRYTLDRLRSIADFFILPTRAECAGIVFCEAAGYGIPSISYKTGGTEDYIIQGETGLLFDLSQGADDFAKGIIGLAKSPNILSSMKEKSRSFYEKELNWERFGESIAEEINLLLSE